ncbi:MAG: class I SAM-dependent methyltransferase [Hyphomicrobiaceae bacterium]|nr:class I SAM-dependent methyltransferase [Hyphomicrobiaceae bacterium]
MFIANYPLKSFVQKLMMFRALPRDYVTFHPYRGLQARALEETMDFITAEMPKAVAFDTPKELMEQALKLTPKTGIVAEFGVNEGGSIAFIAKTLGKRVIDGFDSFEGLPEDWSGNQMSAGYFNRGGKLPKVPSNVRLHPGWFNVSLPKYVTANPGPVAFLHVDCDLYSSTATIFELLGAQCGPGTVIVFDEYFNYPAWKTHEHKAFTEFIAKTGRTFDYIGYSFKQVAIILR